MSQFFHNKTDSYKIMIVEDSSVQAKKLRFLLEENGFEVEVYSNGSDAYKRLEEVKPILIISDIVMPEMDGYEFCTNVKASAALREIPIILLTSLRDPLDIIKGLQAGADNFITKPYEENYLMSRIQYLLANRNIRQSGGAEMVIEIMFKGNKYAINSEKKQILDLLLSVYEAAIQRNDELIQTQAQLEAANEDLISANHELESFAHTVSHDLRAPLHLIKGYAQVLEDDYSNVLDEPALNFLKIIDKSVNSMARLVEDLLNFSRSAHADLDIQTIDIAPICHSIINKFERNSPERKVQVEIESDLRVKTDPGLIEIVLENLLSNAWKYTGKKPDPCISVGQEIRNNETVLFVRDNGDGFEMANVQKLFTPFQRLHTNQEFQGTGVGLATVKRIIERHGGRIWAEGEKGSGATFYWTIPDQG